MGSPSVANHVADTSVAEAWCYDGSDECGRLFTRALKACEPNLRADARVLEIGCAEFSWLFYARQSWPEMSLTGIDTRWGPDGPTVDGATTLERDVLTCDFPAGSFDWIVAVSTIEHVGVGYYGDPICEDGDSRAIQRAYTWLAPGGWLYFDVPHGTEYSMNWGPCRSRAKERVYDEAAVRARLHQGLPWKEHWSEVLPLRRGQCCRGVWWQKPS